MTKGILLLDASTQAALDRFMELVIHDLRATLRESFLRAQLLERSSAGAMDPASQAHLFAILEGNRLTSSFLTRLAEYCQAGSGLDRFPPMSAELLIENAIQTSGAELGVKIDVGNLPTGLFPAPLQKVFFELLDNSRKFRRGPVSVGVNSTRIESEWIVEIRDNGIGFEPEYAKTILEPLQRLHGAGAYPGFGLGLAISQRIVRGLHGRLWADSVPGQGSTFYVSLPAG